MKKLMIAAAIVCAAVMANAATLNWNITAVPASGEIAKTSYTAYLFQTAGTDFGITTTLKDIQAALASNDAFSDFVDSYGAVKGKNLTQFGGVSGATGFNGNNFAAGDSFTGYAVILDNSLDDAKNYIITDAKSVSFTSGTGSQNLGFGSQASQTWTAMAPEPTSGLLLLLGVAGLALKRKQK